MPVIISTSKGGIAKYILQIPLFQFINTLISSNHAYQNHYYSEYIFHVFTEYLSRDVQETPDTGCPEEAWAGIEKSLSPSIYLFVPFDFERGGHIIYIYLQFKNNNIQLKFFNVFSLAFKAFLNPKHLLLPLPLPPLLDL